MTVLYGIIPEPCPKCHGSGILGTSADEGGIYNEECYYCDGTGNNPDDQKRLLDASKCKLYPDN